MKKIIIYLSIIVSFSFASCANDDSTNVKELVIDTEVSDLDEMQMRITNNTIDIYANAWDGNNINIEEMEYLSEKNGLLDVNLTYTKSSNNSSTVDISEVLECDYFSEAQTIIIEKLMNMAKNKNLNYDLLKEEIYQLPSNDQDIMIFICNAIEVGIAGMADALTQINAKRL